LVNITAASKRSPTVAKRGNAEISWSGLFTMKR
jgi:hypothetical protein